MKMSSSSPSVLRNLNERVRLAVLDFWKTRSSQASRSQEDQGFRKSVTGGQQMNTFGGIVRDILLAGGLREEEIFCNSYLELPGYFRAEKKWDVLAIADKRLIAAIEFKSQASSIGNNLNNRAEEAIGLATDLWTAYREGAIPTTPQPWLGYILLGVASPKSRRPVGVKEPHFPIMPAFQGASYVKRYCILLQRLKREKLYQGTALVITTPKAKETGEYEEPDEDLTFRSFATSLYGQVISYQQLRQE